MCLHTGDVEIGVKMHGRRYVGLAGIAVAGLALAACSSGGTTTASSSSAGATSAGGSSAASTASAPFKVAFLLPGSPSDQSYNADGQNAADAIKKQLGASVTVTDNVSVPNQADVYRQYASQGYNVVIGWGGQFTDGATTVAKEFPKVDFIVVNGEATNGTNLGSIDENVEDWEFIGGFVAEKLSKSGTIGWIGGQCFPATAANLHGVEQGAKYANPNAKILSTFTGSFEDPTKAQQAAQAMIGNGADALTGNLNSGWLGVYKAAQNASPKAMVVNEWLNSVSVAPDVIASSILKSQAKFVVEVVKKVQDGTFGGKHYQFKLTSNWGPAISKSKLLPDSVYQAALAVEQKITSGQLTPQHNTTCPK